VQRFQRVAICRNILLKIFSLPKRLKQNLTTMIFGAIDIGSNAVRLMFANALQKDQRVLVEKATLIRIPIRLGKDVYHNQSVSAKRAANLIKTLKAFKLLIEVYKPVDYVACATAAMREADNGQQIIKQIKKETGLKINIITGLEEAEIIRTTGGFSLPSHLTKTMYIDLGGGSCEISVLDNGNLVDANSFKIGTLRMLSKKVDENEWERMKGWLQNFSNDFGTFGVIGSGGNINKLTKLYGDTTGNTLSLEKLEYAYQHLRTFTLKERINHLGLRPDRADVIVPAARVFLFILRTIKAKEILAPKIGLADGLIHNLFLKHKELTA
jgi:exopolyphosphatase/guanosine-5'-triphosphate,3'-diphosphate pyrophosphatase